MNTLPPRNGCFTGKAPWTPQRPWDHPNCWQRQWRRQLDRGGDANPQQMPRYQPPLAHMENREPPAHWRRVAQGIVEKVEVNNVSCTRGQLQIKEYIMQPRDSAQKMSQPSQG